MSFEDFFEKARGVRRSVLICCVIWTSAIIGIGLWAMMTKGLSSQDVAFLTASLTLMQVPVAYYFQTRREGK